MRFAMLSVLTALALSTVASATASAYVFNINGKELAEGEKIEVIGNAIPGENQLEGTVAKSTIATTCQGDLLPSAGNVIEERGKLKVKIEFKACTVVSINKGVVENLPKCRVKGGEFAMTAEGELTGAGELTIKPKSGEPLVTLTIEEVSGGGACTLTGTYKVEGSQVCTLPHFEVQAAVVALACNPAGGKVKLGGESARLYTTVAIAGAKGQKLSVALGNPPPAPRIEWSTSVETRVSLDHRKAITHAEVKTKVENTEPLEKALEVSEYEGNAGEGKDTIEWKSPGAGTVTKNWPLAYEKSSSIKLKAWIALEPATRTFLEHRLEETPPWSAKPRSEGNRIQNKYHNVAAQLLSHPVPRNRYNAARCIAGQGQIHIWESNGNGRDQRNRSGAVHSRK
jgi:hypothetical protein